QGPARRDVQDGDASAAPYHRESPAVRGEVTGASLLVRSGERVQLLPGGHVPDANLEHLSAFGRAARPGRGREGDERPVTGKPGSCALALGQFQAVQLPAGGRVPDTGRLVFPEGEGSLAVRGKRERSRCRDVADGGLQFLARGHVK